ncbi:CAP domain-containing protein [Chloroflexota bacterium]
MRNKTIWLLNVLILLALLLVSCAPTVIEEEEKLVTEEEDVTDLIKEEEAEEAKEFVPPVTEEEEKLVTEGGDVTDLIKEEEAEEAESMDGEEESGEESQLEEPQPEEPQPIPEEVQVPVHKYQELALFSLELINEDRVDNGLDPVILGGNIASQNHAEENLTNVYSSHWGMDGSKPYMRYTLAGGVNYVNENVLGTGIESDDGAPSLRDPKEMLEQAQERLMDSHFHRANILYKWHKKVSLGIAYDDDNFHLLQHFEGDYIEFSEIPSISSTILSMIGKVTIGNIEQIALHYDPLPQSLSPEQLNAPPYVSSYSLGGLIGNILPPLPPGSYYTDLAQNDVVAMTWDTQTDGSFTVEADISPMLGEGNGVYTVVVLVETGGEFVPISNYSIFVQ